MSTERRRITGPRRVAAALAVAITTAAAVAPLTAGAGATRAASPASTGSAAGVALAAQAGVAADQSPFLCTTEFNGLGQPIVDNQEKLMLAKVRFQDALAELTLPDAAAHLAVTTP